MRLDDLLETIEQGTYIEITDGKKILYMGYVEEIKANNFNGRNVYLVVATSQNEMTEKERISELRNAKREKERLHDLMISDDFKLYSQFQRVETVKTFNRLDKKIIELEER